MPSHRHIWLAGLSRSTEKGADWKKESARKPTSPPSIVGRGDSPHEVIVKFDPRNRNQMAHEIRILALWYYCRGVVEVCDSILRTNRIVSTTSHLKKQLE
jgi:hypothetical protein